MSPFSLDEKELLLYQPNRPPFLMIDYVSEVLQENLQMVIKI